MILETTMTVLLATSSAAPAPRHSGAEIQRDVKKLSVLGTALYIAAHPDDENTRLLATLANETNVRAAYLSLTRGEGGQNLIGGELGPLLGMIRTQELLAARRVDGAEQYFTRARDFGYSKSVDETLSTWDHDAVLADVVFVIRTLRPDVIITRFPLEAGETHGHHTASARLALEAFKAAADPAFAPGSMLQPWKAKRIVWNAWSPDPNAKIDLSQAIQLDSSAYSPLLGLTYGELAADSRSMHKSQGFGAAPVHGPSTENFLLLGGDPGKTLFEGVELGWARVPKSAALMKLLAKAAAEFKADKPSASLPVLFDALDEMRKLPDHPFKQQKLDELAGVIADCAGVFAEASSPAYGAVPGASLDVVVTTLVRATSSLKLRDVKWSDGQTTDAATNKVKLTVPTTLTTPDWLAAGPATSALATQPEPALALYGDFTFISGERAITLRRPVAFKWTDPTVGERFRPIEVLPPVLVKPDASLLVFADGNSKALKVLVTANADAQSGELSGELPTGWTLTPAKAAYALAKKGDTFEATFQVKPAKGAGTLKLFAQTGDKRFDQTLTRIEYLHIPIQTLLTPAEVKLQRIELAKGKTRLGYIVGAGDEVPQALRQVGYEVTLLDDEALRSKPLGAYDAIIVGIRAFNTNPKMPAYRSRLMQYVTDGGTLVVQYNTKNRISDVPAEIGPWPFEISHDRVTEQNALVTLESHPVFGKPNKLGPDDFAGWVQERGLYFAGTWDPKYVTPLSMHDANEPARKGSLLIAKSGKGTFIYTGLAFFRQLPAGVPGAYRLFANLLAANAK